MKKIEDKKTKEEGNNNYANKMSAQNTEMAAYLSAALCIRHHAYSDQSLVAAT